MSFMSWDFKEVNMDTKDLSKFSIRTSDRRVFRRCLRKWDFQSSLRQNLTRGVCVFVLVVVWLGFPFLHGGLPRIQSLR